jgi:5-methyltetrahydropteroyltriglutamate--homocysteine methyltransferase
MITANLGFPRIGSHRELKFAVERFWQGTWSEERLQALGAKLRRRHWRLQAKTGIQQIPSNDFSFYDHVLDTSVMVGAVPARFRKPAGSDLARYFSMARGTQSAHPMQMTKWFDTNYHYIVPEFEPEYGFLPQQSEACTGIPGGAGTGSNHSSGSAGPCFFCSARKMPQQFHRAAGYRRTSRAGL